MDAEKMMKMQIQLQQNNNDLLDYMKDLDSWQEDIKIKEAKLNNDKPVLSKLPSIRNLPDKKHNVKETNLIKEKKVMPAPYSAWDKFDVDKACNEIDASSRDDVNIQKLIDKFKEEGNNYFKKGKLNEALESYTKGLELDSSNVNLIANRALILLKQENYAACEMDCSAALILDERNLKCLLRRGTARSKLKKYKEALDDFEKVLLIENHNKQAISEVASLKQLMLPMEINCIKANVNETGVVKAIYKPIDQRSKKAMKRINISEINLDKIGIDIKSEGASLLNETNTNQNSNLINSKTISDSKMNNDFVDTSIKTKSEIKYKKNLNANENPSLTIENSFQFQKAWKHIKNNDEQFLDYFSKLEVRDYPKIFGECLEYNMLSKIWYILKNFGLEKNLNVKNILLNLPRISRFQMNMMFLSPNDKNILYDLISNCQDLTTQEDSYLRDIYLI